MDKPKQIDMAVMPSDDDKCCSPVMKNEPNYPGVSFYGKHFEKIDPFIDDKIKVGDEVILTEVTLRLTSRTERKENSDLCFDIVSIKGIGEMGGEDSETEDDSDSE